MAGSGLLSQRFPNPRISFPRRSIRSCKNLILLVFFLFGLICFGMLFYLPDLGRNSGSKVESVYNQIKRVGPELLIPPPPAALENSQDAPPLIRHEDDFRVDPHIAEDRERLDARIREDNDLKVLEKPDIEGFKEKLSSTSKATRDKVEVVQVDSGIITVPPEPADSYPLVRHGGEDPDQKASSRREKIVEMTKHAWDNYVRYAWGKNELRPISKRGHSTSIFGQMPLGATILDAVDTLFIMGLDKEFKQARDWIANELDVQSLTSDLSVFETNIRFVGGLLACYALTGDVMFRDKAQEFADKLLPAFNSPSGIPMSIVNFKTGLSRNYAWASGSSSILSEIGTLHLEFAYLSDITGNPIYREKVNQIRQVLRDIEKPNGLYPNYLNPKSGKWGTQHVSMGALGDSFYEYLLKAWLQSNKEDEEARVMFGEAMDAALKHLLQTSQGGLKYFAELKYERLEHKMDHLGCYNGGLLGLGSHHFAALDPVLSDKFMDAAVGVTNTCYQSYNRSDTKLGPEAFRFNTAESMEAKALKSSEKYYILRPETIESYFYMWRLTKNEKYRDWAWQATQAIEKYCRVPGGYTGIKNVYSKEPIQDDVQQSFFLAETLKYLYLIFSDDNLISLDQWVLNTEAHPLPIKGKNPYYRKAPTV